MNVNLRFCSWLFKHGLFLQSAFVLKVRSRVLFILPGHNEQPGEGGRLADRALIRASRGLDKRGERDIPPVVLNRGGEGQSSSVVMVEGSDTCCHQIVDCD